MNQRTDKQGARRPRSRQRDPEVRRERLARVRRGLLVTAVVLGVAGGAGGTVWGVAWLLSPAAFPLESVHFDNRLERVQQADLRRALDGHLDAGFWGLDLSAIRGALEALPWVEAAAVRRVWPGELRVGIREQRAVAVWNGDALIGASGEVFAPDPETWPGELPQLAGNWDEAIDLFETDPLIARIFPADLIRNLVMTKRQELAHMAGVRPEDHWKTYLETV